MSARRSALPPAAQGASLCIAWPSFRCRNTGSGIRCQGVLQPTPISARYTVCVEFKRNKPLRVWVVEPALNRRSPSEPVPHVYPDKTVPGGIRPCLYLPSSDEFDRDGIAHLQIIPWLCEWLFHYEMWHITGVWSGGGKHPEPEAGQTKTEASPLAT